MQITVVEKPGIKADELAALRKAVGWDGDPDRICKTVGCSYFWAGAFAGELLVGYIEVVSDGVDDAYIRNLMVHPRCRHRGLGLKLLGVAADRIKTDGIRMINVLFEPALADFYRKAGFKIICGGLMDNRS